MDTDSEGRTQNKIYASALFLYHLLHAGGQNIARTPVIFKIGILLLHIACVLYITGFASPYWVVGEKHDYRHDAQGRILPEDVRVDSGGNVSSHGQVNDTHFGLWEECVVVDGESVCTIFTDHIDSVILMFGCVGGFILFGLCCWSCFSCVSKPKKCRYVFIIICSVVGGVFGLVCLVIFLAVQGVQHYSWALALFVISCLLEVSSAAVFLGGIMRATKQGVFPVTVEETADTTTQPCIIVTGPTPTRKNQPRSVHVIHKGPQSRVRVRGAGKEEETHVDFVTLDMVSAVPAQSRTRKKKKRKRKRKGDSGSSGAVGKRPVESLALQVAERLTIGGLVAPPSPPSPLRPFADTKPDMSASNVGHPWPLATSLTMTEEDQDQRPASVYIDLTRNNHKTRARYGRQGGQVPARHQRTEGRFLTMRKSDFRWTHSADGNSPVESVPMCLLADVHQPDDPHDPISVVVRPVDSTPENVTRNPSSHPNRGEASPELAPSWPRSSSFSGPRTRAGGLSGRKSRPGTPRRPPSADPKRLGIPDTASTGARRKQREQDEAQYVKYSPDTYYQSRAGLYSF